MSVKRFIAHHRDEAMHMRNHGGWVKYTDYETIETEHKAAMLTISGIMEILGVTDYGSISEQVAALLKERDALEQAQKSNEFLKVQLSEIANFNPDWDKLEASYESWREIAAELLVAKNRIAELESAPNSMMQLSNELAERMVNNLPSKITEGYQQAYLCGYNSAINDCAQDILAATLKQNDK